MQVAAVQLPLGGRIVEQGDAFVEPQRRLAAAKAVGEDDVAELVG